MRGVSSANPRHLTPSNVCSATPTTHSRSTQTTQSAAPAPKSRWFVKNMKQTSCLTPLRAQGAPAALRTKGFACGPPLKSCSRAPAGCLRRSRPHTARHSTDVEVTSPSEARQLLSPEQEQCWQAATEHIISNVGVSDEAAGAAIAKGHAWTSRAYWGAEKVNMVPDPDHVLDVLQYLQFTLGLEGPDLQKVLKVFPEVLACSLEERLEPNVQRFEQEWFMKGDVLKKAIVRKPTLLGLSVDCSTVGSGACMGQCSKCWSAN